MTINPEYLSKSGTEHGEQTALFCWANQARMFGFDTADTMDWYGKPASQLQYHGQNYAIPQLEWMYAIPNGGGRSAAEGGRLKAEGVKGGVADVCLPVPVDHGLAKFHGLYIEMKKAKGIPSNVSDDQIKFARFVLGHYYHWEVCFGWREAAVVIRSYLTGQQYTKSFNQLKVFDRLRG